MPPSKFAPVPSTRHEPPGQQRLHHLGVVIIGGIAQPRSGREHRFLPEDRFRTAAVARAGIDSELVGERLAGSVIHVERLRLPAGAVEREHQLAAKPLSERKLLDERFQLGDEARALTELEICVDPLLDRVQAQLLEPADLVLRERLEREIGERRAPPQASACRSIAARSAASADRAAATRRSNRPRSRLSASICEHVARRSRHEHVGPEQLAELRDEILERRRRGLRRLLTPELVDEAVGCHDLARPHEQEPEQRTLLLAAQRERRRPADDFERPEDAELDHCASSRAITNRARAASRANAAPIRRPLASR